MAMRVAIARKAKEDAERDYRAVQAAAQITFAEIRRRGIPSHEVRLPDGTKVALITIDKGAEVPSFDEDALLGVIAVNEPGAFEDFVDRAALSDPKVLAFMIAQFPDHVRTRIRADVTDLYRKEAVENGAGFGLRAAGSAAEQVGVAVMDHEPASGGYSVRWADKGMVLLGEAMDAGVVSEWGEHAPPPALPAEPEPDVAALADAEEVHEADGGDTHPGDTDPTVAVLNERAAGDSAEARLERARSRMKPAAHARMEHTPTGEQQAILDAWTGTGKNLTIRAGAGSGKTSTLVMLGEASREDGFYVAYNKAIATEARRRFPRNVGCSTAHALAFAAVGRKYAHRLNGPRIPAREAAKILRINEPLKVDGKVLAPEQAARLTLETAGRFMRSADRDIGPQHVPSKPGLDSPDSMKILRKELVPWAVRAWADLRDRDGRLRFEHDAYLKIWQLGDPVIDAAYVLLDEAQDADPVVTAVLLAQKDMRLISVGDPAQQIYAWRGAIDAMDAFDGHQLTLSQSFRFGPAIADEANKWLELLGSDLVIRGTDSVPSAIGECEWPEAGLCRTNRGALGQVIKAIAAGKQTAVVGGGKPIRALAEAAASLQAGRPTTHPELFAFANWPEVVDYAENDPAASDLQVMVRLIDEHGADEIIRVTGLLADERHAEVIISTAHKAKGLEWGSVRIGTDFRPPKRTEDNPDPEVPADAARLAYVAVTRAKLVLDREGLAWVDRFLPGGAA